MRRPRTDKSQAIAGAREKQAEIDPLEPTTNSRTTSKNPPSRIRNVEPNAVRPLRDGGISWIFYFRESEVPRAELATIARAERDWFLRLAVTFGSRNLSSREYRSTTAVHLWQIGRLPPKISWRKALVHVFTHEPLHHAIGRCLEEISESGDQEWAIEKLGDRRWW